MARIIALVGLLQYSEALPVRQQRPSPVASQLTAGRAIAHPSGTITVGCFRRDY